MDVERTSVLVGSGVGDPIDRMEHGRATRLPDSGTDALLGTSPGCLVTALLRYQKAFWLASRIGFRAVSSMPAHCVRFLEAAMVIEVVLPHTINHFDIEICAGTPKMGDDLVEQHRLQLVVKGPMSPPLFRLFLLPRRLPDWCRTSRRIESKRMAVRSAISRFAHNRLSSHGSQEHQDAMQLAPAQSNPDCHFFRPWSLTHDVKARAEDGSRTGAGGATSMIPWSSA
jgi:hypothetical protein